MYFCKTLDGNQKFLVYYSQIHRENFVEIIGQNIEVISNSEKVKSDEPAVGILKSKTQCVFRNYSLFIILNSYSLKKQHRSLPDEDESADGNGNFSDF